MPHSRTFGALIAVALVLICTGAKARTYGIPTSDLDLLALLGANPFDRSRQSITLCDDAETSRVSVSSTGEQANGDSAFPALSADGRFVGFESSASDLVPGDTNGFTDIFVHDRQTGETSRVNVSSTGEQANGNSSSRSISADGRFVAFESSASNLVPGDTNGYRDVFVHDRQTGETSRVSVSSTDQQGNDASRNPSVSADGRFVAFESSASNLVPGDTNGFRDIFVHDRQTGETSRVSVSSTGQQGNDASLAPSTSADGRFVAFESSASDLVPGDTNGYRDVFVHDRQTGETSLVSVSSTGEQGNGTSFEPSISADGRFVAFRSAASDLVPGDTNDKWDIFVHDRQTGQTSRVSVSSTGQQGNSHSGSPTISADGRFVGFESSASNLVPGDTNGEPDIFVHDRQTGQTSRVSVSSTGQQGNNLSWLPSISADGRFVAFSSAASDLVPGDTNGTFDIFVHDPGTCDTTCPADFNGDTVVNSLDFLAFLSAYVAGDLSADFNGDTIVNDLDFFAFLNAYVAGCP